MEAVGVADKRVTNENKKKDKSDDPPSLFRKKSLWGWGPLVFLTFVIAILLDQSDVPPPFSFTESEATDLLYVNAEILATMLTVTLGITLLGMQFRAQSYSLVGMMEYMNDKVVYGFTAVFAFGTIFSIIAASEPNNWMVFYAVIGTVFSFCYHAAYIYHLVYKLQVSQMLGDNYTKMTKSAKSMNTIESTDIKHSKPFEIWEGIMKRIVETGNYVMFKKGLKSIYQIINDQNFVSDYEVYRIQYSKYLVNIKRSCLEHKQYQLVEKYTDEALKMYSILSERKRELTGTDEATTINWLDDIIDDLETILYNTIDENEYESYENCLSKILTTMWNNVKTVNDNARIIQLSDLIKNVIIYGASKNSNVTNMFVTRLMTESNPHEVDNNKKFFLDHDFPYYSIAELQKMAVPELPDIATLNYWHNSLMDVLEQILIKAGQHNDKFTYLNSIRALLKLGIAYEGTLKRYLNSCTGGDDMLVRMNSNIKRDDERWWENRINAISNLVPVFDGYDYQRAFMILHNSIRSLLLEDRYLVVAHILNSFVDEEYTRELMGGDQDPWLGNYLRSTLWNSFDFIMRRSLSEDYPQIFKSVVDSKYLALQFIISEFKHKEIARIFNHDVWCTDRLIDSVKKADLDYVIAFMKWSETMVEFLTRYFLDYANNERDSYIRKTLDKGIDPDLQKQIIIDNSIEIPENSTESEQRSLIIKYFEEIDKYADLFSKDTAAGVEFECAKYFGFYNYVLAIIYSETGNPDTAMEYIDASLYWTIDKQTRIKIYLLAGDIQLEQKQYTNAEYWYRRVFDIEPKNIRARDAINKLKNQRSTI